MEPPSPTLAAALRDLELASPRDLRRARQHCKRLARDLPAFDSVWIDSLVRLRKLTLFQALELQANRANRLSIGEWVLLDRYGGSEESTTYLVHRRRDRQAAVLKEIVLPAARRPAVELRLRSLAAKTSLLRSGRIIGPDSIWCDGDRLAIVSPFVPGRSARDWLIRQGRMPASAVATIAQQLLAGLVVLHEHDVAHGDIHAGNVRIDSRHGAVLVDAGVRNAIQPCLSIHELQSPCRYEGTAPERIGTGEPATTASDAYALGCLLWHLLAGRPAFSTGDPLALLVAHRSQPLPSICEFAPETPSELVELIAATTHRDAKQRCTDFDAWRQRLRSSRTITRRRQAAPSPLRGGRVAAWPLVAGIGCLLGTAGFVLANRDAASTLLSISSTLQEPAAAEVRTADRPALPSLQPLPEPDRNGIVTLDNGPYAVGDVARGGPIVFRGSPKTPTTIVVVDRPCHVRAEEVTFEHVQFICRSDSSFATRPAALLLVESQNMIVRSCRFETATEPRDRRTAAPSAIAWRLVDRADPTAGRLTVENCVARGVREVVLAADPLRQIHVENMLGVGTLSLVSLQKSSSVGTACAIERSTLRDSIGVVRLGGQAADATLRVAGRDSVFDFASGGALFTASSALQSSRLSWSGTGVVTSRNATAFATFDDLIAGTANDAATSADISVSGVTTASIGFAGAADNTDAASTATVSGAGLVRQAGRPLGVDLQRLPTDARHSTVSR